MTWIQLRSRRDPAFWAPVLLALLVLVPLAIWAHASVLDWVEALRETASSNPEAARDEAVRALRLFSWGFLALSAAFSAFLFRFFQLGLRESRLPPSGWRSLGAFRAALGPMARRMSKLGIGLSVVLLTAAIGFVLAVHHLLRLIQEGRLGA